jgi:negative regulator of sigma E activity
MAGIDDAEDCLRSTKQNQQQYETLIVEDEIEEGAVHVHAAVVVQEEPMPSLRTTVPECYKTPKIHPAICSLSVVALVLLTSPVGAQQHALQGEVAGYLHAQKDMQQQPTPTLKGVVEACAAIVRKETDERLKGQASEFDAYITADGSVANVGTDQEDVSFGQCMNEQGHPLGEWE